MRYLLFAFLFCFCGVINAQVFEYLPNDTTTFVEFRKGQQWAYKTIRNLTVGMTVKYVKDEYGKYYQIHIYVENDNKWTFVLNPDRIEAVLETEKDKNVPLLVYSYDRYMKKVKRRQDWEMVGVGFAIGMNAGFAGYKTAHVSGWSPSTGHFNGAVTYHDASASTAAIIQGAMFLDDLDENNEYKRNTLSLNYLQKTSIHPGEHLFGHVKVKRKKGNILHVSVPFAGSDYNYDWKITNK